MLEGLYSAIKFPFVVFLIVLGLIPTTCVIIAIFKGHLNVPMWIVLFNPLVTSVFGWTLRAVKKDVFYDMPAIMMNSVGSSLLCVVSVVSILG